MKYNNYRSLLEIQTIFSSDSFKTDNINDRAKVVYLFVLIRKLYESLIFENKSKKYGLLYFYCTWILHVNINRNIWLLQKISHLMLEYKDSPKLRELLTKNLSLKSIPQQINDLIIDYGMTTKETIDENTWKQIEPILIDLISTAPLMDKSGKEYLKEISIIALPGVFFGLYDIPVDKYVWGFKLITKDNKEGEFIGVAMVEIQ